MSQHFSVVRRLLAGTAIAFVFAACSGGSNDPVSVSGSATGGADAGLGAGGSGAAGGAHEGFGAGGSGATGGAHEGFGAGGYASGVGGSLRASGGRSGSAGFGASSSSGGFASVPPGECFDVQCKPPPCCGGSCTTNSECCKGTICGKSGRCIPESCSYCGPAGCTVDFDACTAECVPPTCCKDACQTDADCCPGTMCGNNTKTCIPTTCKGCTGMRNLCTTKTDCSTACVPPDNCGIVCTSDVDCGLGAVCNTFLEGQKLCVPTDFKQECAACGNAGCRFIGKTCDIECKTLGAGGSSSTGSGGSVGAGGSVVVGAGGRTSMGSGGSSTVTPACLDCCAPCTDDDQCCTGYCSVDTITGTKQCTPSQCRSCDNGCTYRCSRR